MTDQHIKQWVLCIDQGGHASRAIVFDDQGEIKAKHECMIRTISPSELIVEHDPEELIGSVLNSIREVFKTLGEHTSNIGLAALATQRSSIVCWDKQSGDALSPVISWADRRAIDDVKLLESHRETVYQKTGLVLNAHYGFSKMKWCLKNMKPVQRAYHDNCLVIGSLASFILFRILREAPLLVDYANGARTLLVNVAEARWDEELLELCEIPSSVLPRLVPNCYRFGTLSSEFQNVPLMVCTGDQSAALFSNGWPGVEAIYVNAGTGAFLQQISEEFSINAPLLQSLVYSNGDSNWYVTEGTVNGAARALQWYKEKTGYTEINWSDFEYSDKPVPIFINGISGLGSPYWRAEFSSYFIGSANHRENIIAIFESIAFLIHANLELFQNYKAIYLTGGLANVPLFAQAIADLATVDVFQLTETEATSRGLLHLSRNCSGIALYPCSGSTRKFRGRKNLELKQRHNQWAQEMKRMLGTP